MLDSTPQRNCRSETPSSSSSATTSVHLSLNRKDELLGSSPQDSLQALGITSGKCSGRRWVKDGGDHKLLVIAVHAVLIESGFVGFDSVSRRKVEGFHLPDEWPSLQFTMSLQYTLPEIIKQGPITINGVETVKLKFQSLGKFVNVYGSLAKNGSGHMGCAWIRTIWFSS
ncbi:putative F-box protein [Camellia lanceoleosa]|uniref:F-box protein n=1 Tax=Camellia lanceoleosa TaxID=1840588 RepID=A0ACC0FQU1_9ERIC|nr:putative F-box protein [Camellia lanceoleosa]